MILTLKCDDATWVRVQAAIEADPRFQGQQEREPSLTPETYLLAQFAADLTARTMGHEVRTITKAAREATPVPPVPITATAT